MFHDLYMKTVVAYIENHIAEKLHARVLSDVAGYDEDYFRRVFRNAIGVPPARYVERRRLSHAALHLRNSLRSVSNIAALTSGLRQLSSGCSLQNWCM